MTVADLDGDGAKWRRPPYLPADCKIGRPHVIEHAMPFVKRRGCALQAGAHVGVWPAALAPHFDRVVAFEPLTHLWRCSVDAVRADNVLILPCALTSGTGSVRISPAAPERYSGSSAVGAGAIEVPAIRVDDLPGRLLADLGIVLLDIEGHELPALQGAPKTLHRWRPVVVVEQNAKSLRHRAAAAIGELLAPLGYRQVSSFGSDLIFSSGDQHDSR